MRQVCKNLNSTLLDDIIMLPAVTVIRYLSIKI